MSRESKKNIESVENNNTDTKPRKKKKKKKIKIFRLILLIILIVLIIVGGSVAGMIIGIAKSAPEIDPTNVLTTLTESSVIVDENGSVIEQIHDPNENREIVKLSNVPKHLQEAFISIEDQRYIKHFGIDIHHHNT